jgi:hypothetical protein
VDSETGQLEKLGWTCIMGLVSSPTTRGHRNWQAGEVFTVTDASELYEIGRWGKGYFSISPSGHVLVHPTKDPNRSIDLKQLTDHRQLRARSRLRKRWGEIRIDKHSVLLRRRRLARRRSSSFGAALETCRAAS